MQCQWTVTAGGELDPALVTQARRGAGLTDSDSAGSDSPGSAAWQAGVHLESLFWYAMMYGYIPNLKLKGRTRNVRSYMV